MEITPEPTSWTLKDGRNIQYYRVGEWSFSNLPEEDFDYDMILNTVETWKTWGEFVKNNPHLSAGAAISAPEDADVNNGVNLRLTVETPVTDAYSRGYEAGLKDGEAKNAPPF
jgi:hypothetical protein